MIHFLTNSKGSKKIFKNYEIDLVLSKNSNLKAIIENAKDIESTKVGNPIYVF